VLVTLLPIYVQHGKETTWDPLLTRVNGQANPMRVSQHLAARVSVLASPRNSAIK